MVLARFLPHDERFFDYFRDAANNAAGRRQAVDRYLRPIRGSRAESVRRLREVEHRGDEITHQIFNALNRTFVTPLDREDISALASAIDDFVDAIEEIAKRCWLYRIDGADRTARGALPGSSASRRDSWPRRCHWSSAPKTAIVLKRQVVGDQPPGERSRRPARRGPGRGLRRRDRYSGARSARSAGASCTRNWKRRPTRRRMWRTPSKGSC